MLRAHVEAINALYKRYGLFVKRTDHDRSALETISALYRCDRLFAKSIYTYISLLNYEPHYKYSVNARRRRAKKFDLDRHPNQKIPPSQKIPPLVLDIWQEGGVFLLGIGLMPPGLPQAPGQKNIP